jgi:hypothetical protein
MAKPAREVPTSGARPEMIVCEPMDDRELQGEIERLRAENERLKVRQSSRVALKVSEKGGVSVYGLGRFPVTLYKEQWLKLLEMAGDIRAFIAEHEAELKTKKAEDR